MNIAWLIFMLSRKHPTDQVFSCVLFSISSTVDHATVSVFNLHVHLKCQYLGGSESEIKPLSGNKVLMLKQALSDAQEQYSDISH